MKKEYKKPTFELMYFNTALMSFPMGGSGDHGDVPAPERREPF